MARRSNIYREHNSLPKIAILVACISLVVIGTVALWYASQYTTTVSVVTLAANDLVAFIGILIGIWGGLWTWRYGTKKVMDSTGVYELATEPDPVKYTHHVLEPEKIGENLSEQDRLDLAEAQKLDESRQVNRELLIHILAKGGIDHNYYHTPPKYCGEQGFTIIRDPSKMIRMRSGIVIPYIMTERTHSQVEDEVMRRLENFYAPTFRRNQSVIDEPSDFDPGVIKWLQTSIDAQRVVLSSIGYDGLSYRFATQVTARFSALGFVELAGMAAPQAQIAHLREQLGGLGQAADMSKLDPNEIRKVLTFAEDVAKKFPATGVLGGTALGRDAQAEVKNQAEKWFKQQPALTLAMGAGTDDRDHWRHRAFELQGEVNELRLRLGLKSKTVLEQDRQLAHKAVQRSQAMGVQGSGSDAVWDLSDQAPVQPKR